MTATGLGLGGPLSPLGLPGTSSFDPTISGNLLDGLGLTDTFEALRGYRLELSETIGVLDYPAMLQLWTAVLSDTLGVAPTDAQTWGAVINDAGFLTSTLVANQHAQLVLSDDTAFTELLTPATPAALSDGLGVAPALGVQLAAALSDILGLTPALLGAGVYRQSLADQAAFLDTLARFIGVDLVDTLSLSEALVGARMTYDIIEEHLGLAETLVPLLLMRVELADELDIEHSEALSALYNGVLQDGIELTAAYLAPDGSFTTWVMNTRTAAVTEYQNYTFNSFAQIGQRYVGASSGGLYWLDGDDDLGEDIIARMKGGYLQFGGTKLSRLKAAYIAMRGEGEAILKIITGDGAEYVYSVDTRDMRSTKVHMGKGQRARYFSYELTTVGRDFDLETLEFVPIVVQRRV